MTTSRSTAPARDGLMPDGTPDVMFLLSWVNHALALETAAGLAGLGISTRAYCVLYKGLTGEFTQSQLGDMCGIDKTTMVVTVDELERLGLAERRLSRTDRRARIVAVTPAGEEIAARATTIVQRIQQEVLSTVPAPDRDAFVRVLSQLVEGRLASFVQCGPSVRRRAVKAG
ncbi:MarR family winged helix-turn-helix transcriptional regulator [Actinoplanes sp. DH11]|uniref:MarR family winged helix-turn-helix transcriptional regulator n=1 Tax=Actinoplanes sp. DH11 TaxID=2857011 RepID=UPI001E2E0644|nr:MarR family transcriptional regulator [Actinoplanes sp. DH11]